MSVRKQARIRAALLKKGFEETADRDHAFYFYIHDGRKTGIYTKLSHAARGYEIDVSLFTRIARQVKLNRAELESLVQCPLTAEGYRTKLVERGYVA